MTCIVVDKSTNHAKPHSIWFLFCFLPQYQKDNEVNLCQDLLTVENTDSDLKVHALHFMQMSKNFWKVFQHVEAMRKR